MKNKYLKHYYNDVSSSEPKPPPEVDKNLTIGGASTEELHRIMSRLYLERDVQNAILDLRRNSQKDYPIEKEQIDTVTPINQLYHHGIKGQRWGVRRYKNEDGSLTKAGQRRSKINAASDNISAIISGVIGSSLIASAYISSTKGRPARGIGEKIAVGLLATVGGLGIGVVTKKINYAERVKEGL